MLAQIVGYQNLKRQCSHIVQVGSLSSVPMVYKTPTRQLRVEPHDQNYLNAFEGNVEGEDRILLAIKDKENKAAFHIALLIGKIVFTTCEQKFFL